MSVPATALWLIPGQEHPVFRRFSSFFGGFFQRYEAFDYRARYLEAGERRLQLEIAAVIERLQPELVLYSQFASSFSYIAPPFLAALRARSLVVGLGFDDEMYFEQSKYFYQCCNAVVTTDLSGAEWLRQAGIAAYVTPLQLPHSPAAPTVDEDIAISFVGDMTKPGRRDYVHALEAAGLEVQDYGHGSRRGAISDAELLRVFMRSKINLNFTATNPPRWVRRHDPLRARLGQIKGRPFELAVLGRFCLCEWAPCVEHWFQDAVDIALFRDRDELVAKAREYLANDALRRRVAAAAAERYSASQADSALRTIFGEILRPRTRPAARALYLEGRFYEESMGRSHGAAFLHALRRGAPLRALGEIRPGNSRPPYWRGFFGGIRDAIASRLPTR